MMSLDDDTAYKYPSWKLKLAKRIINNIDGALLSMEGVSLKVLWSLTSAAIRAEAAEKPAPEYKLIFEAIGEPKKKSKSMAVVNNPYVSDYLLTDMLDVCGEMYDAVATIKTLTNISKHYPEQVIHRAISETKDAIERGNRKGSPIINKPAFLHAKVKEVYKDGIESAKRSKKVALVID